MITEGQLKQVLASQKAQMKRTKNEDDKKTYQIRINLIKFLLNANEEHAKKY